MQVGGNANAVSLVNDSEKTIHHETFKVVCVCVVTEAQTSAVQAPHEAFSPPHVRLFPFYLITSSYGATFNKETLLAAPLSNSQQTLCEDS